MVRPIITTSFIGIPEVRGILKVHPDDAVRALQEVVSKRAHEMKISFVEAMMQEYTSLHATGRLARSITHRTLKRKEGVELRFYIQPFRELEFVTSLFGGYFKVFPVTPYPIFPRNPKRRLAIRKDVAGGGRVTLRMLAPGQAAQWGKETGGFRRDVLKEVGEEEGQFFLEDVTAAMEQEVAKLRNSVSGGKIR